MSLTWGFSKIMGWWWLSQSHFLGLQCITPYCYPTAAIKCHNICVMPKVSSTKLTKETTIRSIISTQRQLCDNYKCVMIWFLLTLLQCFATCSPKVDSYKGYSNVNGSQLGLSKIRGQGLTSILFRENQVWLKLLHLLCNSRREVDSYIWMLIDSGILVESEALNPWYPLGDVGGWVVKGTSTMLSSSFGSLSETH